MTNEKSDMKLCGGLPCQWPACEAHGKQCRAAEPAQAPVGEVTEPDRIHVGLVDGLPRIKSDGAYVYYTDYKRMRESLSAQVEALKKERDRFEFKAMESHAIASQRLLERQEAEQRAEEAERKATFWQGSSEDWKQHKKRRDVELAAAEERADRLQVALRVALGESHEMTMTEVRAMLTAARTK